MIVTNGFWEIVSLIIVILKPYERRTELKKPQNRRIRTSERMKWVWGTMEWPSKAASGLANVYSLRIGHSQHSWFGLLHKSSIHYRPICTMVIFDHALTDDSSSVFRICTSSWFDRSLVVLYTQIMGTKWCESKRQPREKGAIYLASGDREAVRHRATDRSIGIRPVTMPIVMIQ